MWDSKARLLELSLADLFGRARDEVPAAERVRPRLVWSGTGLMIVGFIGAGVGRAAPKIMSMKSSPAKRTQASRHRPRSSGRQSLTTPVPTLRYPGAMVLIVVGVWLCMHQWLMAYPFSVSGQNAVLRDVGLGVVLVLSGLRL